MRSWVATWPSVGGVSIVFPRPWQGPQSDTLGTTSRKPVLPSPLPDVGGGESHAAESAHKKLRIQEKKKIRRTYGADITKTSIKKH